MVGRRQVAQNAADKGHQPVPAPQGCSPEEPLRFCLWYCCGEVRLLYRVYQFWSDFCSDK